MKSTGASQRAAEVASAMLSVPGYADDTMLFMMRYGALARETLRKVDWDEFQVRLSALNEHWFASGCRGNTAGDGEAACTAPTTNNTSTINIDTTTAAAAAAGDSGTDDEEASRAAECKARALELVQEFPPLVRDFDRFVECTRIMATRYGRRPQ